MIDMSDEITFKNILPYTALASIIFMSAWLMGHLAGLSTPEVSTYFGERFNVQVGVMSSISSMSSHPHVVEMFLIFATNAFIGYCFMSLGFVPIPLSCGMLPISAFLGYKIGAVLAQYTDMINMKGMLLLLVPHGAPELTALFMCIGIGFMVSYRTIIGQCGDPNYYNKNIIKSARKFYFSKIIPVFFVAAVIETFVTNAVYHYFM
jgi:uncharacterized membrane protein SpoIIM required for sporulation